ncbi:NBR1-Ig-like domain-containing protein [Georgenia alba]|uniref:NBR1-Ig-like domain-containing protein n=1 Tax=Georgenia alba TaxID=2233858 RepID=A0ABW2QB72_9MICO
MAVPDDTQSQQALDKFVSELRELRAGVGDPSFRQMAKKSGAVSHATLHQTVTGHRLQPWETVREFVRACDGDEELWHARWREAADALPEGQRHADSDEGARRPEAGAPAAAAHPETWWRTPWVLAAAVVVAIAAITVSRMWLSAGEDAQGEDGTQASADGAGGDVPDPAATEPVHPGDAAEPGENLDVTYPDGSPVAPDESFTKIWEIVNAGTVVWQDRYLERLEMPIEEDDCVTPERVPIARTEPGEAVEIAVNVRAPERAGVTCTVHWKMVDADGTVLLPGHRPIFFEVRVTEPNSS